MMLQAGGGVGDEKERREGAKKKSRIEELLALKNVPVLGENLFFFFSAVFQ
jgi:hypothetical protein